MRRRGRSRMNDASSPGGHPAGPLTLAIDIGGTRLKASVLAATGRMIEQPDRVDTPHPAKPDAVVALLEGIVKPLGAFDRISIGFPGVVRHGRVITAPNLGTDNWHGYPLAETLQQRLGKPARMLNDATVQGLGVISGRGLECVITLGTGMGFALFDRATRAASRAEPAPGAQGADLRPVDRQRSPAAMPGRSLEPPRAQGDRSYRHAGELRHAGDRRRQRQADRFRAAAGVRTVSNEAGITGGIRLWDPLLDPLFVVDDVMALPPR